MRKRVLLFSIIIGAISSAPAVADPRSSTNSPLLGDYSSFKKDKEDKSNLIFRHEDKKVSDYAKFIVDPVLIYPSSHRGGPKYSPANRKEMSDYFRSILNGALKDGYELTEAVGPGTLRLRFGIRDLKPGRYYLDSDGSQQVKPETDLAEITLEMEGIDSLSGERIIAIVRNVQKEEVKGADRDKQVQRVSDVFAEWVQILRSRLDQANIPK